MDAHRRLFRFWSVLAVTFLAAFMAQVAPAHAQDASPDVLNKVTKLNKKALDAYQKKDFDTARSVLKDALDLCASAGLDKHPIKARTHIHLGIVLITGFKQRDAGIKHFKKALQIQPDIQLTKSVSSPTLQDAFEEAMVGQTSGGGGDDTDQGGQPQAGGDEGGTGANDTASGDETAPPRRRPPPPKKKKKRSADDDDQDGGAIAKRHGDDDGDGDDDDDRPGSVKNAGRIFAGLTLGSGFGVASGTGETASRVPHALASAGFAPAQLIHIAPEVGYFIKQNLMLSVQARYQIVTGVNSGPMTCGTNAAPAACSAKTSAIAVFAKATYLLLEGDFHVFIGGSVGGGAIRHVSNFPADKNCVQGSQAATCVDTLQAGPFLVGPNAGIIYDLGKTASLIVALNTQLGVPKFTFNVDGNVGVGLKF